MKHQIAYDYVFEFQKEGIPMNKLFQYNATAFLVIQKSIASSFTIFIALILLTSHPSHASEKTKFPKDIATFIKNRDGCDHFRGEEPYDKKRQQFLEKQMRELCTRTDKKLKLLKLKYKSNEKIMEMLIQYEEQIESGS
jgi:hypothetical protein